MPWSTPVVSELRTAFVHAVRTAKRPVAQAARDFQISRKTAYKWLARFDQQQDLADRSRRPKTSPTRTATDLEAAVLGVRTTYGWGPRKIHAHLRNTNQAAPPVRTVAEILNRHGCVRPTPDPTPTEYQRFERPEPNDLWQLDFKGWVEIERLRVAPLTILDDHSRFLVALHVATNQTMATAWDILWAALGEYGMPRQVLCDNAFGSTVPHVPGVSWFESRLIRLGIRTLHGRPYHPQTQGKVERLHGTLVREVYPNIPRDTVANFTAALDHWRRAVYNPVRPHEALADQPPSTRWRPSPRPRPGQLPVVEYPPGSDLRTVGSSGDIRYRRARILAGRGIVGERVRVEETDGWVDVYYADQRIRRIALDLLTKQGML